MKRRSIETRFWKDGYIHSLNCEGRYFFLYLLSNEHINIIHTYELPDEYIVLETGLTLKKINELKDKFQRDNKFLFKDGWIKIVNGEKYERYEGSLNDTAKRNLIKLVPTHIFQYFNTPINTSIDTPPKGSSNQYSITSNKKGIVKGEEFKDVKSITPEVVKEISIKYQVNTSFVEKQKQQLELYCESKGITYKNYKATLMAWVLRKLDEAPKTTRLKDLEPDQIEDLRNHPEKLSVYTKAGYDVSRLSTR